MSVACWGPVFNNDLFSPRCSTCARRIHFVPTTWLVPITSPDDPRSPGYWRHNPRRVARA